MADDVQDVVPGGGLISQLLSGGTNLGGLVAPQQSRNFCNQELPDDWATGADAASTCMMKAATGSCAMDAGVGCRLLAWRVW